MFIIIVTFAEQFSQYYVHGLLRQYVRVSQLNVKI